MLACAVAALPAARPVKPAAAKPAAGGAEENRPRWVFSLLPRSLQKHPLVDFNVITEMTEAGRRCPPPSLERPVYVRLHAGGPLDLGSDSDGGGRRPNPEFLDQTLRRAMAENGILVESPPEHPATVQLIYHWGYYARFEEDEFGMNLATEQRKRQELFERALLVGGRKFALDFAAALARADDYFASTGPGGTPAHPPEGYQPIMGDLQTGGGIMDPLEQFMERDPKTRYLVEESMRSCYFVTVSAYDLPMLAAGKRLLLWRTKMTVNADGVAMAETLLPLISHTAAFLARDMTETATLGRRISREGRVELGPLETPDWDKPGGTTEQEGSAPPPQAPAGMNPEPSGGGAASPAVPSLPAPAGP